MTPLASDLDVVEQLLTGIECASCSAMRVASASLCHAPPTTVTCGGKHGAECSAARRRMSCWSLSASSPDQSMYSIYSADQVHESARCWHQQIQHAFAPFGIAHMEYGAIAGVCMQGKLCLCYCRGVATHVHCALNVVTSLVAGSSVSPAETSSAFITTVASWTYATIAHSNPLTLQRSLPVQSDPGSQLCQLSSRHDLFFCRPLHSCIVKAGSTQSDFQPTSCARLTCRPAIQI